MANANVKTKPTNSSVVDFLAGIDNEQRRIDAIEVNHMMERITGEKPKMWGSSIVGFGDVHYKYESGREGDLFGVGFSPRKTSLTLYIMPGFSEFGPLMTKLGKHKTGKSCLYITRLDDIDRSVLEELIAKSYARRLGVG